MLAVWTYRQSNGVLTRDGVAAGTGYSGMGVATNNPAMQNVANQGPLPQGSYSIGAALAIGPGRTGKFVLPLRPDPANQMFGRSGFYIHGDNPAENFTASDGCIVLSPTIREAVAASGDHELAVVE
jgi:hypothetical protein